MVKGWVEQVWTVWKGPKGIFLVKIWQQRIQQLEWQMFLERASIMQRGHIRLRLVGHFNIVEAESGEEVWHTLSLHQGFLHSMDKNSSKDLYFTGTGPSVSQHWWCSCSRMCVLMLYWNFEIIFITPQSNNFSYKITQTYFLWLLIKSYAYFAYIQQFPQKLHR